jgi:ElaB/YqjD/DUF883 family membrane-anchored ribosome-binding protein
MKRFDKKVKARVKNLPVQAPKDGLWESISKQLEFNEKLSARAKELPMYGPMENSWKIIEQYLKPQTQNNKTRDLIIGLSAAASIGLLIGIYLLNRQSNGGTISVSTETVSDWRPNSIVEVDTSGQFALRFIEEQCKNRTYVCNMPGFNEKKQQLNEVNNQINEIEQVIHSSGSTPTIMRSRIKLENIRTRLVKELINQIAS